VYFYLVKFYSEHNTGTRGHVCVRVTQTALL